MPYLIMKTKVGTRSLKETGCVGVVKKSTTVFKKSSSVKLSKSVAELDMFVEKFQDNYELCCVESDNDQTFDDCEIVFNEETQYQTQLPMLTDTDDDEKKKLTEESMKKLKTIFSPSLEENHLSTSSKFEEDIGTNKDFHLIELNVENNNTCSFRNFGVSDLFISDLITAALPIDGNLIHDNGIEINPFHDYKCGELFEVDEECILMPLVETSSIHVHSTEPEPCQIIASHCPSVNQIQSCNKVFDLLADSDHADDFDPQIYIKNYPELSDVMSNVRPIIQKTEFSSRKSVTLVLDLDETLVHSSLDHCGDADFTFNVFFNLKEHTVYVKQRPHLHTFLERVAEMFEVVIFTASQSIYAEQLLDILDPEKKFISRRVYRESCVFSDGSYTKDLTVLGLDLAKVAIVDNTPQVFRLQINNGIPIKSWFDDPSDCALISLLPFLETLVDAEDVRPLIAKRFGNMETEPYSS